MIKKDIMRWRISSGARVADGKIRKFYFNDVETGEPPPYQWL
jgi:hypothetical protein